MEDLIRDYHYSFLDLAILNQSPSIEGGLHGSLHAFLPQGLIHTKPRKAMLKNKVVDLY